MIRIVGRDVFEGTPIDSYAVRVHELGHGHREVVVQREVAWCHIATMSDAAYAAYLEARERDSEERAAEKEEANRRRAARRATTAVRRKVKAAGFDSLLTLTYRGNQGDLALCKQHMKEFVRRVRRVLPGFAYLAGFERQQRGAWHVHLCCHRVPPALPWAGGVKVKSWAVLRAIWRSVTGELGGNIDFSARKRRSKWSSAKLAAYVSKYILKAFEDGEAWSNRWSSSDITVPTAVRMRFEGASMAELLDLVYSSLAPGAHVATAWLFNLGDTFYLASEGGP